MGGVVSSIVGGASSALTPQNNYHAVDPAVVAQQQALAGQLADEAAGQGPNQAQAQYQQNTQNNINQAAGFAASQKGSSPALAARNAGIMAGKLQANAAGQAASVQAGQQQAALGQQAGVLSNIGAEETQTNQTNAGVAGQNAAATQNTAGGLLNGVGSAFGFAEGGQVPQGSIMPKNKGPSASQQIADQMMAQAGVNMMPAGNADWKQPVQKKPGDQMEAALNAPIDPSQTTQLAGGPMDQLLPTEPQGLPSAAPMQGQEMNAAHGGEIPPHLEHVARIYHGWEKPEVAPLKAEGGPVPGKAKVAGDSPKNDTVKTMLSPGEVVIPRSIMQSKDPAKGAAEFVAEQLKKGNSGNEKQEFHAALKKAIGKRKA